MMPTTPSLQPRLYKVRHAEKQLKAGKTRPWSEVKYELGSVILPKTEKRIFAAFLKPFKNESPA